VYVTPDAPEVAIVYEVASALTTLT